jgi:hypothetical protein
MSSGVDQKNVLRRFDPFRSMCASCSGNRSPGKPGGYTRIPDFFVKSESSG